MMHKEDIAVTKLVDYRQTGSDIRACSKSLFRGVILRFKELIKN